MCGHVLLLCRSVSCRVCIFRKVYTVLGNLNAASFPEHLSGHSTLSVLHIKIHDLILRRRKSATCAHFRDSPLDLCRIVQIVRHINPVRPRSILELIHFRCSQIKIILANLRRRDLDCSFLYIRILRRPFSDILKLQRRPIDCRCNIIISKMNKTFRTLLCFKMYTASGNVNRFSLNSTIFCNIEFITRDRDLFPG